MKEKLLNNWVLKICSVLGAVVIWLLSVNAYNPTTERTISGVKVKILNEDAVTGNGLAYDILNGRTVDFVLTGPRDEVSKISAEDCVATVDFKELAKDPSLDDTALRNVLITYSSSFPGGVKVSRISTEIMQIRLEEIQTKTLEIEARYDENGIQEGYNMDQPVIEPSTVTITGRASILDSIGSAGVELDVSELTDNTELELPINFYNAGGNQISLAEGDLQSISASTAKVSLTVQKVKELVLDYKVLTEPAEGYRCSEVTCEPERIKVKGSQAVLSTLSVITVPSEALDITGARESQDIQIDVTPYLPEGVTLADSSQNMVTFHIEIEPVRTRTLQVPVSQIQLTGMQEQYRYEFLNQRILVTISGLQTDLDEISAEELVLTAEVGGLAPGSHAVSVNVELAQGLSLESVPSAEIQVTDTAAPEETEESSGSTAEETEETSAPEESGSLETVTAG